MSFNMSKSDKNAKKYQKCPNMSKNVGCQKMSKVSRGVNKCETGHKV